MDPVALDRGPIAAAAIRARPNAKKKPAARPGAFASAAFRKDCTGTRGCPCGKDHVDGLKPPLKHTLGDALACSFEQVLWLVFGAVSVVGHVLLMGYDLSWATVGAVAKLGLCGGAILVAARTAVVGTPLLPAAGSSSAEELRWAVEGGDARARRRCLESGGVYAKHLAEALRCETVSYEAGDDRRADPREFEKLHALLERLYPLAHAAMERRVVNRCSLVYKWPGRGSTDPPYACYGHLDVVPPGNVDEWSRPPFSGDIAADRHGDRCVWGRGAIDDKNIVLGHFEAIEDLIGEGFAPTRDVYLCLGHDEEVGGREGAKRVCHELRAHFGVERLDFLLDEGLFVTTGVVPSHPAPVAMICVAEKGVANVKLTATSPPGHASVPRPGALRALADAVGRIERSPMRSRGAIAAAMFRSIAGGFRGPLRVVVANLWLFGPILTAALAATPETASIVRTTTAVTIFRSGEKKNVLPAEAVAWVNHRIHPADDVASVVAHDVRVVADETVAVELDESDSAPASAVSPTDHAAYARLRACVLEFFGIDGDGKVTGVAVAPSLFVAASDSKHFSSLTDNIYRFNPILLRKRPEENELDRFHGYDERIAVDALATQVAFYRSFHARCSSPAGL